MEKFRPAPESERAPQDKRQEAADELYDALAPVVGMMGESADEDHREKQTRAMNALLTGAVSELRGEAYTVNREEGAFFLATRDDHGDHGSRLDDDLGVFAEPSSDFGSGAVKISYDVRSKSSDRDGYDERFYDEPVATEAHLTLVASPEAQAKTRERIERTYAAELAETTKQQENFDRVAAMVRARPDKRVHAADWDSLPELKEMWPWADGAEAELSVKKGNDGADEVELVIFESDGNVRDIVAMARPKTAEKPF